MEVHSARWCVTVLAAAALLAVSPAAGQDKAPQPAAAQKPAIIPTSVFAASSPYGDEPQLSPDGKHVAYFFEAGGASWIGVIDIDKGDVVNRFPIPKGNELLWISWAGHHRLLLSLLVSEKNAYFEARFTRLFVYDTTNDNFFFVGPRTEGLDGDNVIYTDPDGKFVLLSVQRDLYTEPQVWRFSLDRDADKGEKIEARGGVWHWITDDKGEVRVGLGVANGKLTVWYRKGAADKLEVVAKLKADDKDDAAFWNVVRLFAGRDDGLALKPGPSGHIALRKFNYATREVGDVIYENPEWDLDDFAMDEQGNATAVYFTDDEDHVVWLDPKTAQLQADFTKALGGTSARILQVARDKSRMLVQADAANNPGAWYVYTPATHQLGMFSSIRPELDPALLAPAKPVTYNARDGTRIRAYLTLPRGREAKALPLIVMPHGGPYGIRDKLQYDDEVQLLANRGYAVLQPDYRGSGGFGQAFEDLGKGQIGRKMQDDLDDAMDWAVKQGIADPKRVCLVGGSYGGYAALWGVIRNPERYRCAASYAGVTDWQSQLSYDNDFFSRSERNAWREKIRGTDRSFDMTSVSPLKQVTLLKRPVLLGHGKQDHTVPFSEFEAMRNALGQNHIAGAEYVVLEKSPHGFADAKEKQAWLDALAAFLQKNNPAN